MIFRSTGQSCLRKREDNSSVTRFACATFPTREGKAPSPKEVDYENSTIHVTYWHGPFCYEKSTMEGEKDFPLTEKGQEEMLHWLEEHI